MQVQATVWHGSTWRYTKTFQGEYIGRMWECMLCNHRLRCIHMDQMGELEQRGVPDRFAVLLPKASECDVEAGG